MSDIIYPTVDLFLYDLRDGLGQNPAEIEANRLTFLSKLPKETKEMHGDLAADCKFEAEYVELFGEQQIYPFGGNTDPYQGFYYPVRQGDTYGLLLDCSINQQQNAQPAKCIKDIKSEIDRRLQGTRPTLGKSWVIYGQIADPKTQNTEDIAKICYHSLLPDCNWQNDLQGQGTFAGATIFELSHFEILLEENHEMPNQSKKTSKVGDRTFPETGQNSHHVMIILYPNAELAKKVSELLNYEWMRLFGYRAKILWAYSQTRWLKQCLKFDYITIEDTIKQLRQPPQKKTLKQLDSILAQARKIFSDYAIDLAYLEDFTDTIWINLENYQMRSQELSDRLSLSPPVQGELGGAIADLNKSNNPDMAFLLLMRYISCCMDSRLRGNDNFLLVHQNGDNCYILQKFSQQVKQKYLRQLEKESKFFRSGLNSLEILIETIRTSVELERTERDRTFQNSVAIWGIGLAAGSIVASISAQFPIVVVPTVAANQENDATKHPLSPYLSELGIKDPWLTPAISTTMSLGSTLIFALIIWGIIKLWERLFEKRRSNKT